MRSMGMRNGLEHSTAEPHKSRGDDERLHPTCLNLMAARCIKARDLLPGVPLYFMDYRFMDYRNRYSSLIAHPCICLLRTLSPSIPLAALAPPPLPLTPRRAPPAYVIQHGGHPHPSARRAIWPSPLPLGARLRCTCKQLGLLLLRPSRIEAATQA